MAKGELNLLLKLSQFIKSVRKSKGWSVSHLADLTNKDKSYIYKLEDNKISGITLTTIQDILEALDCDIDFKKFE